MSQSLAHRGWPNVKLGVLTAIVLLLQASAVLAAAPASTQSLDFEFYRTRVEPIFLKNRPGHARCVVCHAGSSTWSDEQSRRNFQIVSRLVTPGDPASSRLLLHPLAPAAGGDIFHSGGRQFASRNDPDWLVLAAWVRNAK